ncbi:nuclear export mediator factor NEMF isoform X2 [Carex littledalei]|uniref:Nuclear export mediator factor NEMF isoform X2 n=1 Tax=Carex littledalei TaxID=544730 RepID=A0A833VUY3_9POAL|nr:nuclear export mediator factor NEMF isoform X2 [Carex littledalei]
MVKVRMNTADVAAEVKCLRRFIGMRCSNVYDLSPKTYMFKLMNSSGMTESGESEKVLLLIESGVRLHTTQYVRDKSTTPSGFTLKLRKHIRSKRLEDVRQLGYDRIILFQFGLGESAHYIILELYAQGNILLTDSEYSVMTLLRSHRDDNKGLAIMSRHRYPIEACRTFERTDPAKLREALILALDKPNQTAEIPNEADISDDVKNQKKKKSSSEVTLKSVLSDVLTYGPALSEHIILEAGLVPGGKVGKDESAREETFRVLGEAVKGFEDWLEEVILGEKIPGGFILMKQSKGKESTPTKVYDEYCPILLNQLKSREYTEFETFDAALDEFYSKIESQRSEQQQRAKEDSAVHKLNKIKLDQENRVLTLRKEVDYCTNMAQLIEYNLEDVDAAIMAVRVALANGMNWDDLKRMIKEEKKLGNPVAGLIDKLYLERNCITLLLSNNLDDMYEEEKTTPVEKVEVDLALSAHANARRWYEMKKKQESKQEKTITAHEKAFKAAEKKTRHQLAQEKTVAAISHMRKVHWFEKFNWFISSENYLVISGRDAQQNEMVVKRYMSKGDIYVHADLHGASSTIIKNHRSDHPIPPLTVNQAGCFTVCHSQAWDSKIVTSAWWVYPHQVSKTAPTGEYLTVGSFMIRGKKNFLPPHPLVMGFGLLFRIDESSLPSHLNERRVRTTEEEEEEAEARTDPNENASISVSVSDDDEVANQGEKDVKESSDSPASQLEDLIDKTLGVGPIKSSNQSTVFDVPSSNSQGGGGNEIKKEKPYVSKAERKKLKKGSDSLGKEEDREKGKVKGEEESAPKATNQKPTRGQRGKLKKMKEKYADQDEEEREIRMTLLASAGNVSKKEKDVQDEDATVAVANKPPVSAVGQDEATKICYKCKKPGHLARDCREGKAESNSNTEPEKIDGDEEDGTANETGEGGDERDKLTNDLDLLTGNPLPDDVLLYAVPVCGPYNAVQSYKYRVKITPGVAKKGKAAKTAINLFLHTQEVTSREKELIKACTDPEMAAAIVGNVKITAPGLTQLKHKQKKGKKASISKDTN